MSALNFASLLPDFEVGVDSGRGPTTIDGFV
jgi:hypothetical protein